VNGDWTKGRKHYILIDRGGGALKTMELMIFYYSKGNRYRKIEIVER